jgi:hypothetical protein
MLRSVLGRLGLADSMRADVEYYACPCCLTGYSREAVAANILTEEHVPPEGLGGRGMLLTCATCNHNSGRYFDAHARTRADAEDFVRGKVTGRQVPATSHADGIPLRGVAQRTEDGIQMFGVPKRNDPRVQAAHFKALDAYVDSGDPNPNHSFTIHTRYEEARARLSWIRSAYLAAFAAFGWSYIFRSVMDPLREQLQKPDERIVPTYILRDTTTPPDMRRILLVDDPDELRCVAVVTGEHTVFLPGLFRTQTFEEITSALASLRAEAGTVSVNFNGKELPWPARPTYFLDRPADWTPMATLPRA